MFVLELQSLHEQLPSAEWADWGCDGSADIWDRTTLHVKLIYQTEIYYGMQIQYITDSNVTPRL